MVSPSEFDKRSITLQLLAAKLRRLHPEKVVFVGRAGILVTSPFYDAPEVNLHSPSELSEFPEWEPRTTLVNRPADRELTFRARVFFAPGGRKVWAYFADDTNAERCSTLILGEMLMTTLGILPGITTTE